MHTCTPRPGGHPQRDYGSTAGGSGTASTAHLCQAGQPPLPRPSTLKAGFEFSIQRRHGHPRIRGNGAQLRLLWGGGVVVLKKMLRRAAKKVSYPGERASTHSPSLTPFPGHQLQKNLWRAQLAEIKGITWASRGVLWKLRHKAAVPGLSPIWGDIHPPRALHGWRSALSPVSAGIALSV